MVGRCVPGYDYILKPGQEYEGTWHLEGMVRAELFVPKSLLTVFSLHERIVASVICYYKTGANIQDPGLIFRYMRCLATDFPNETTHQSDVCLPFFLVFLLF
jgi:hypothetical protein